MSCSRNSLLTRVLASLLALSLAGCGAAGSPHDAPTPTDPVPLTGTVRGTVRSSLGPALSGVRVTLLPTGGTALTPVVTDTTGVYQVARVPTGAGAITVTNLPATCTPPAGVAYTLVANTTTTRDITVACTPNTNVLNGTLTGTQGAYVEGLTVTVTPASDAVSRSAITDATGRFVFQNLPVGPGMLQVTGGPVGALTCMSLTTSYDLPAVNAPGVSLTTTCTGRLRVQFSFGAFGPPSSPLTIKVTASNGATRTATADANWLAVVDSLPTDSGTIAVTTFFRQCGPPPTKTYAGLATNATVTVPYVIECVN